MKKGVSLCSLALLLCSLSFAFSQDMTTAGDQSPAVVAEKFHAQYDVRPDVIYALLKIYEKEGLSQDERKSRTESLLKKYQQTPEKKKRASMLSDATKKDLKLSPEEGEAFDWDLFGQKYYLSTGGFQSPAVYAPGGEVNIWYGIPPKVVRALADFLEQNKVDIADLGKQLEEQVKKYGELKAEFEAYGPNDPIVKKAEQLLEEGKLLEVEKLIDFDYAASKKRQAYKGYLYGKTKELLLKYDTAAIGYRDAVFLDPNNSKYLRAYADIEDINSNYDIAIEYYQKALAIDSIIFKDHPVKVAELYYYIGDMYRQKKEFSNAAFNYEKCKIIVCQIFKSSHHYCVDAGEKLADASHYHGMKLYYEKKYAEALLFFQKALESAQQVNNRQLYIVSLNNIGSMLRRLGSYEEGVNILTKGIDLAQEDDAKSGKPIYTNMLRRMRYHRAGCLAGLGRKKEADELYQQLLKEAKEVNDTRLLEDLKNDGVKE